MIGSRFGMCVVLSELPYRINRAIAYVCKCDCGNEFTRAGNSMRSTSSYGGTVSCGCHKKETCRRTGKKAKTHGMSNTNLYTVWVNIHQRCYNKNQSNYKNYGARGISVCSEWHDPSNFIKWADKGYAKGLTLDRIDSNGNYSPENCRWADWKTQQSNRRNNTLIEIGGEVRNISSWARKFGNTPDLAYGRIKLGWPPSDAVSIPPGGKRSVISRLSSTP